MRAVGAFEISDTDGIRYEHPLLGGLNVPRPQLLDIDGDGDLDLFVQELSGQLMFFEQVGPPGEGRFLWRTDRYLGLDVGEWYRFVDMDDDGDFDLLAEERFSHIRYYRNDGGPQSPFFVLAADTLRDVEGVPIFSDRQNIPNVADVDCDGRPDLLLGRLVGTVTRYEAEEEGAHGVPRFRLVTDRFQDIEIVARIGSRHGANTMELVDIDHDGDEDLFWGDFFEPGLLFIENTGSCEVPVLRGEPVPFPPARPLRTSGYNAPTFGDVDGNGTVDLLVGVLGGAYNPILTAADNLYLLDGEAEFGLRTRRFLNGVDVGSESIPAVGDLDGDGDLDLLLANKIDPDDPHTSRVYRFDNVGTVERPRFRLAGSLDLGGLYHYSPALADLDADGDLDLLLGSWKADVAFYRNEGSTVEPRFVLEDAQLVTLTRGSNGTPALVDIDADGDLDLFVGEASGTLNFYRNEGTPLRSAFTMETDEFGEIDIGRRSFPSFVDLDLDGDPDLVLGSEDPGLTYYRNDGTREGAAFVPDSTLSVPLPPLATPIFADIDGDGDADLLSGGIGGGLVYFENRPP
ncbi:MAG: FG-GAP repeat domain-containing protein [Gemmatimonadota bacterium]